MIYDLDIASAYPNILLRYQIFPEGAGPDFLKVYQDLLDRRLKAKKEGRKLESDSIKICLNATFGKLLEPYSKLFDPVSGVAVCLNGEMILLRLMDLCFQRSIEVLMANTDGILVRGEEDKIADACKVWEKEIGLTLETKKVVRCIVKDSNNLILKYADGTFKIKGAAFAYTGDISKQVNFPIINFAVCEYLLYDKRPEDTIEECEDIYQFLGCYAKGHSILEVKRAMSKEDPGLSMPNIVRYYLGPNTEYSLYRRNGRGWTRCSDSEGCVEVNKISSKDLPRDINYAEYIRKAKKKLSTL